MSQFKSLQDYLTSGELHFTLGLMSPSTQSFYSTTPSASKSPVGLLGLQVPDSVAFTGCLLVAAVCAFGARAVRRNRLLNAEIAHRSEQRELSVNEVRARIVDLMAEVGGLNAAEITISHGNYCRRVPAPKLLTALVQFHNAVSALHHDDKSTVSVSRQLRCNEIVMQELPPTWHAYLQFLRDGDAKAARVVDTVTVAQTLSEAIRRTSVAKAACSDVG